MKNLKERLTANRSRMELQNKCCVGLVVHRDSGLREGRNTRKKRAAETQQMIRAQTKIAISRDTWRAQAEER